jgi:hypothetical protein
MNLSDIPAPSTRALAFVFVSGKIKNPYHTDTSASAFTFPSFFAHDTQVSKQRAMLPNRILELFHDTFCYIQELIWIRFQVNEDELVQNPFLNQSIFSPSNCVSSNQRKSFEKSIPSVFQSFHFVGCIFSRKGTASCGIRPTR